MLKNTMKRIAVTVMALAMVIGMLAMPAVSTQAASQGKLVKGYKVYTKQGNSKKWKTYYKASYTYNSKKDPTKIVTNNLIYKSKTVEKFAFTYSGNKKVSMKKTDDYGTLTATYDSKGRRVTEDNGYNVSKIKYNSKNLISAVADEWGTTKFKYKYYKNKRPKSLKSKGNVSDTCGFNKKGFATHFRSYNVAEPFSDCKYTYNKNGTVKSVVITMKDGSWKSSTKVVFSYTGKKIPMTRYRAMINEIVTGSDLRCGTYWY